MMLTERKTLELRLFAEQIRLATVEELVELGFGHVGGAMSICELLAVLYGGQLRHDVNAAHDPDRDYLVCSKGHAGPAVYSALALRGFMPLETLKTLNKPATRLPSHCDRNLTPGIDMTTGSLGLGLSVAAGICLGNRIDGRDNYCYAIVGDGEAQEGQIWEAVMAASHHKLSRLIAFIDYNRYQINGKVEDINNISNFSQRFESFGWNSIEVNGHDVAALWEAIDRAKVSDRPSAIVMHTVKGYGCKYALEQARCHSLKMPADMLEETIEILRKNIRGYENLLGKETVENG